MWRCGGLNPGPFTCKANALPLSYIPDYIHEFKIFIGNGTFKILVFMAQHKCSFQYNVLEHKQRLYCAFCAFQLNFSGKTHKISYLENKKSFLFPFNKLFPKLVRSTKKCCICFFENLKNRHRSLFWPFLINFIKIK